MKKIFVSEVFILFYLFSSAQNLDLVVTSSGDSLACKIDSISGSTLYLQMKTPKSKDWIQTVYDTNNIVQVQYNCINPAKYDFKNTSSRINLIAKTGYPKKFPKQLQLERATPDELDFYLAKAMKTKKIGVTMAIAGPAMIASGTLLVATNFNLMEEDSAGLVFGALLFLGGIGTTLVGVPVLITSSSRVKSITKIKNGNFSGVTMKLVPYSFKNPLDQNQQNGVSLSIRY